MKENCTTLYPNNYVGNKVSEYANDQSLMLSTNLAAYHTWVLENHEKSNYMISTLEAKFLIWLAKTMGVKRVLEIGVYLGFSAMAWAEAVGPTGVITGLEWSADYAIKARQELEKRGIQNVDIRVGDAQDTIGHLEPAEPYDLIFIDAQKSGYPGYLTAILNLSQPGSLHRLLRVGGLIVADNVLRSALVVERGDINPASKTVPKQTENWNENDVEKLHEFNTMLKSEPRVEAFLMPLFDGLGMGRLLD